MKGGESRLAIRNIESGSEKVGASQWEESDFTGAPKQPSPSPDQFSRKLFPQYFPEPFMPGSTILICQRNRSGLLQQQ